MYTAHVCTYTTYARPHTHTRPVQPGPQRLAGGAESLTCGLHAAASGQLPESKAPGPEAGGQPWSGPARRARSGEGPQDPAPSLPSVEWELRAGGRVLNVRCVQSPRNTYVPCMQNEDHLKQQH